MSDVGGLSPPVRPTAPVSAAPAIGAEARNAGQSVADGRLAPRPPGAPAPAPAEAAAPPATARPADSISLSPTLAGLAPGVKIEATVAGRDVVGRTILKAEGATYVLAPPLPRSALPTGTAVVLEVRSVGSATAQVVPLLIGGRPAVPLPPLEVSLVALPARPPPRPADPATEPPADETAALEDGTPAPPRPPATGSPGPQVAAAPPRSPGVMTAPQPQGGEVRVDAVLGGTTGAGEEPAPVAEGDGDAPAFTPRSPVLGSADPASLPTGRPTPPPSAGAEPMPGQRPAAAPPDRPVPPLPAGAAPLPPGGGPSAAMPAPTTFGGATAQPLTAGKAELILPAAAPPPPRAAPVPVGGPEGRILTPLQLSTPIQDMAAQRVTSLYRTVATPIVPGGGAAAATPPPAAAPPPQAARPSWPAGFTAAQVLPVASPTLSTGAAAPEGAAIPDAAPNRTTGVAQPAAGGPPPAAAPAPPPAPAPQAGPSPVGARPAPVQLAGPAAPVPGSGPGAGPGAGPAIAPAPAADPGTAVPRAAVLAPGTPIAVRIVAPGEGAAPAQAAAPVLPAPAGEPVADTFVPGALAAPPPQPTRFALPSFNRPAGPPPAQPGPQAPPGPQAQSGPQAPLAPQASAAPVPSAVPAAGAPAQAAVDPPAAPPAPVAPGATPRAVAPGPVAPSAGLANQPPVPPSAAPAALSPASSREAIQRGAAPPPTQGTAPVPTPGPAVASAGSNPAAAAAPPVPGGGVAANVTRVTAWVVAVTPPAAGSDAPPQVTLQTPRGTLSVPMDRPPALGTTLLLDLAEPQAAGLPAGPPAPTPRLPALPPPPTPAAIDAAPGWPSLGDLTQALAAADPALARQVADGALPGLSRSPAGMAALLVAIARQAPEALIGRDAVEALKTAGRGALVRRIGDELARAARAGAEGASTAEWRPMVMPFMHGGLVEPISLFIRRQPNEGESDGTRHEAGTRFLVNLNLTRLGTLQLDGVARPRALDLVIRSPAPLTGALQAGLAERFSQILGAVGFTGALSFQTGSRITLDARAIASTSNDLRI
ncbi:hypothetical protein [Zavarzinia sp. CC-PAN008]|uniref:hypothetical protein n=1 Tax=Zavarzinia sp. CC-PAN008 TaxID=3243332 RepID=UPI003F74982F